MAFRFDCRVHLTVRRKDGEADFTREFDLPFPPYPGLKVIFDDGESDYAHLHGVEYSVEHDTFWCYAIDEQGADCRCGPKDQCCKLDYLDWYAGQGWEPAGAPRFLRDDPGGARRPWQFTEEQLDEWEQ